MGYLMPKPLTLVKGQYGLHFRLGGVRGRDTFSITKVNTNMIGVYYNAVVQHFRNKQGEGEEIIR